jgi:type I restriction enzyme S subunit
MTWYQATVGDACVATSQVDPARSGKPSFRYVDISGIDRDAKTISKADEIPSNEAPSRARKVVEFSDILVSTVRPNLNAVAFVPEELDGEIASTGFAVLRANKELLAPKFLYYWVQHTQFVDFLVANATGASYPAVSDGVVRRAPMPLPPLREQNRIVELLDEADNLRRLRRSADVKAARIQPALFLKLFGDPTTNPIGWPVKLLGDAAVCEINPRSRRDLRDGDIVSFVPMADVDEVLGRITGKQTRTYAEVKKGFTPFQDDDVLFAKITPCMQNGKSAIAAGLVGGVGYGSTEFHVLRATQDVTPEYLYALVRLDGFRNQAMSAFTGSAGQQRVPADFLRNFRLPIPPQAEVEKFSKILRGVMAMQVEAEKAAVKLENQFGVLLQRAFSGALTAKWRQAHAKELLAEMQRQAKVMNLPMPQGIN